MHPEHQFARCFITGEWSPCAAIALPAIKLNEPNIETLRLENGEPAIDFVEREIETQVVVSKKGLEALLKTFDDTSPIYTTASPTLVYGWQAVFEDGTAISQFEMREGQEVERLWADVEEYSAKTSLLMRLTLVGRDPSWGLPSFLVTREGRFYKDGKPIEIEGWEWPVDPSRVFLHAWRRVTITLESQVVGLNRTLHEALKSVTYYFGFKYGVLADKECTSCMLAITAFGAHRPAEVKYL